MIIHVTHWPLPGHSGYCLSVFYDLSAELGQSAPVIGACQFLLTYARRNTTPTHWKRVRNKFHASHGQAGDTAKGQNGWHFIVQID
ncbi:hypothetical protein Salmuc_00109 [Salipiger mucosus DSM 16094]|uniref:Uncharacterized protein n=1 Tax=Salipiger mucosus DSM 16094 TaxID=1123237 RepID=S9Q8N8_9RHOB|nr:hypothetical protein Salmuc_00109 [Salipiger mucosus DSM 16094]